MEIEWRINNIHKKVIKKQTITNTYRNLQYILCECPSSATEGRLFASTRTIVTIVFQRRLNLCDYNYTQ